jgi:enoyl-CoA hydratase/carnithine racemase
MTGQIHASRPRPGVVLLEIDNPPANALGGAVRLLLEAELERAEADLTVRAVVLTGRGKGFCAGDDLREELARGDEAIPSLGKFGRLLNRIEALRVPVIAAVNGHAVGGGLELALACDIRIAAPGATFLAAGVNVGLMASVYRLPRLIGVGPASAMILTGRPTDAERALAWGLITEIHPRETLLDAALDLAERIASRAPLSVEASKRMIRQAFDLTPEEGGAAAGKELSVLVASEDHKTGVKAILAREAPVFRRA